MKKLILFFIAVFFTSMLHAQNVGIGTLNPASSAALDITSTTGGFLPPRMTFAQRNDISNPTMGLVIWCTDCDELQVYNGNFWKNMTGRNVTLFSPPHVSICDEDWTIRNLNVSTYTNGDPIPNITDPTIWATLTTGAYCYYNNDSSTYAATYGKLYNWYAVNDPRGLAPVGWHIPSDFEWATLSTCLGGDAVAGGPMKEIGTTLWTDPNAGATNLSGFTGLPGGYRNSISDFFAVGISGFWWSSSEGDFPDYTTYRLLISFDDDLSNYTNHYSSGFSVRCVRD